METEGMIIEFEDEELEVLIKTHESNDKRYRKLKSNAKFLRDLDFVWATLRSVSKASDLKYFKKLHYELLKYDLSGFSSVRIGFTSKYRLIFEEFDGGIRIRLIEINEHYDND